MFDSYKITLDLHYQKKALLDEIYKITENTIFYDNENDAEKYINLIEKREEIIKNIKNIDHKLENIKNKEIKENKYCDEELKNLKSDILLLIKNIIKLDNKNKIIVEKIKNSLKKELKLLNDSKNINNLYNVENFKEEGYYFDIKN